MPISLPSFAPLSYEQACRSLARTAGGDERIVVGALMALGAALEHESPSVGRCVTIDASGALQGSDDVALADWWSHDCWARDLVWLAASHGNVAVVDWLAWAVHLADRGGARRSTALFALDIRDASRVAMRIACGTRSELVRSGHRSPVRIFQWLTSQDIRVARTAGFTAPVSGSAWLTASWWNGAHSDRDDAFDALVQAAIAGEALVAEFDHGVRRHVLVPIGPTDAEVIDADHYCVDVLRGRGGWLTRLGRWTWDDRPADPLPALSGRSWAWRGLSIV